MFFVLIIVLLVVFQAKSPDIPVGQLWFMLSIFVGVAYVAGFLDSRLFARMDKNKANLLAEAEARYEQNIEKSADPQPQS